MEPIVIDPKLSTAIATLREVMPALNKYASIVADAYVSKNFSYVEYRHILSRSAQYQLFLLMADEENNIIKRSQVHIGNMSEDAVFKYACSLLSWAYLDLRAYIKETPDHGLRSAVSGEFLHKLFRLGMKEFHPVFKQLPVFPKTITDVKK